MDKKDVMYLVAALVLVLIIAVVIKPITTGQPPNTGMGTPTTSPSVSTMPFQNISYVSTVPIATSTQNPTVTPTTIIPWNPAANQTVAFVNPSAYGVSLNQSIPSGTRFNESGIDTNMTTFATISSSDGKSGATSIMYIPFPYWELQYTVTPTG